MVWLLHERGGQTTNVDAEVTVGRNPACTIVVEGPAVSDVHFRLKPSEGPLILVDESAEGTRVNGVRVGRIARVVHGDVIEAPGHQLVTQEMPPSSGSLPSSRESNPVSRHRSLVVEVVDELATVGPLWLFRDAIRLRDRRVLLVMADVLAEAQPEPQMVSRWRATVRASGMHARGPGRLLEAMNGELHGAGLEAIALCAEHNLNEHVVSIACAGAAPPWILRARARVVRVKVPTSVQLGRVRGAHFRATPHHFDDGDTLLLPSVAWTTPLAEAVTAGVPADQRVVDWLRSHPARPSVGAVLCLSVT